MPPDEQHVAPETVKLSVTVPPVKISIRPNLSSNWTVVAIKAEARAIEARRAGIAAKKNGDGFAQFAADETHDSMVAVGAARTALGHLEGDWRQLNLFVRSKKAKREAKDSPGRWLDYTTDHPDDTEKWLDDIARLIDDRNEIEHRPQPSTPTEPHPAYPTNVSAIAANYTVDRATAAVDLLLDFWHRIIDSPSAPLAKWASDRSHVPEGFDKHRTALRKAAGS